MMGINTEENTVLLLAPAQVALDPGCSPRCQSMELSGLHGDPQSEELGLFT